MLKNFVLKNFVLKIFPRLSFFENRFFAAIWYCGPLSVSTDTTVITKTQIQKPIVTGDPILRTMSKNVEITKSERGVQFKNRAQTGHLIDQMRKGISTGIGSSAPKVGVNQRIILIQAGCEEDGDFTFNTQNSVSRIMVNPVITNFSSNEIDAVFLVWLFCCTVIYFFIHL